MNSPTPVSSGNLSLLTKIMGWAQFGLTVVGQVIADGIPTNALGWVRVMGSLVMAVGLHAASSTDGTK